MSKKTKKTKAAEETKREKEYVVIYKSEEHYEVLGYVKANSIEEAQKEAQEKLIEEARYYNVSEAEIDEISKYQNITFDIDK